MGEVQSWGAVKMPWSKHWGTKFLPRYLKGILSYGSKIATEKNRRPHKNNNKTKKQVWKIYKTKKIHCSALCERYDVPHHGDRGHLELCEALQQFAVNELRPSIQIRDAVLTRAIQDMCPATNSYADIGVLIRLYMAVQWHKNVKTESTEMKEVHCQHVELKNLPYFSCNAYPKPIAYRTRTYLYLRNCTTSVKVCNDRLRR